MNNKENINGNCPVYKKYGGCQLQNLSYPEQPVGQQRTLPLQS